MLFGDKLFAAVDFIVEQSTRKCAAAMYCIMCRQAEPTATTTATGYIYNMSGKKAGYRTKLKLDKESLGVSRRSAATERGDGEARTRKRTWFLILAMVPDR